MDYRTHKNLDYIKKRLILMVAWYLVVRLLAWFGGPDTPDNPHGFLPNVGLVIGTVAGLLILYGLPAYWASKIWRKVNESVS